MKKGIILGSLLIVISVVLIPITSLAESNTATERIEKQQLYLKIQENISSREWEPTFILRLLLWIRNVIIIGGLLIIIKTIKNLLNISSLSISS